jgi:hypothetical protein
MENSGVVVLDPNDPQILEAVRLDAEQLRNELTNQHDLLTPADVDRLCTQDNRSRSFVEGFISHNSVSVLIGDSGLGKSPFAYQLGLCVAEGIPFLDMKTERGLVVYADYENGLQDSRDMREALMGHLGIPRAPENFMLWTPNCARRSLMIEEVCSDAKPALLIVDSLRSFEPNFEKTEQASVGMAHLRSVASKYRVAILAIHHVRKPGPDGVPSLDGDDTVLMQWLNQAAGARAIVNQSDSRIAADIPARGHAGELVLRWHRRVSGEAGPMYLERVCNDEGREVGYQRITGVKLLHNPAQEAAYERLPERFRFKDAKQVYGATDDPTRKWLIKCENLGLVQRVGHGEYRQLRPVTIGSERIEQVE